MFGYLMVGAGLVAVCAGDVRHNIDDEPSGIDLDTFFGGIDNVSEYYYCHSLLNSF